MPPLFRYTFTISYTTRQSRSIEILCWPLMQQIFRRAGKGMERREKGTTKWAATIHQVCFPETNTARLLSNHPTLQVHCITVPTEGMRFALSRRLQTPSSSSTLQQNFFEVIRAQAAWEGVRVRANFAASSLFGITMANYLLCASVFPFPSDMMQL